METNLLAIYSIQSNMLSAIINPENEKECLVLLNTGRTLIISTLTDRNAIEIHDALHFYPPFENRNNNSLKTSFYFKMNIN